MKNEEFVVSLQDKGIHLSNAQQDQFDLYFKLLVEWNQKMNLTTITNQQEVYLKHFYDSISASFLVDFKKSLSLADVGAGAGFPSIPLKICFPHLKVTIVDSLRKRIHFLDHLVKKLELDHVSLYHDRAESFAQNLIHREKYDLVLARAVARLNTLVELCFPLVKLDGYFLAMKGAKGKSEEVEARRAIQILGGKVDHSLSFKLPGDEGERHLFLIKKDKYSPNKYPRKPPLPNKNPIL